MRRELKLSPPVKIRKTVLSVKYLYFANDGQLFSLAGSGVDNADYHERRKGEPYKAEYSSKYDIYNTSSGKEREGEYYAEDQG